MKKKYFRKQKERKHARLIAKYKSHQFVKKWINQISNRLYCNENSPVPSDLGLFKAANQRKVRNRKLNMDLIQRLEQSSSSSRGSSN